MSQPVPSATGALSTTPLTHLLVYALDQRLAGSFVFEDPSQQKHAIYLTEGVPAKARTATQQPLLGEVLVASAACAESDISGALETSKATHRLLGEVLVERGVIDADSLRAALVEQVAQRVLHIGALPGQTVYGFYPGVNFLARAGGEPVAGEPLALVWRVIKAADRARFGEVLARLPAVLRFRNDAPLAKFRFDRGEQAVIDVLRAKPQSLSELGGRGLVPNDKLERLLYALAVLRQLDNGTAARPLGVAPRMSMPAPEAPRVDLAPAGRDRMPSISEVTFEAKPPSMSSPAARRSSTPPGPGSSAPDAFRIELRARAESTGDSYYDVLGVARDSASDAIQSAFLVLAKRWHPDRLGPDYADVRDLSTRVFARISEANQVLTDPERRKQYDELLDQGGGAADEQEEVQRVVRAVAHFQRAQVLMKRNNLVAAEQEARIALEDDPSQADHVALVAWFDSQKPGADLEEIVVRLSKAASMEPENLRVRWYRGQLLKRLGHEKRALDDFRLIAERDPRHVDAQRELRLFEMRRGKTKTLPPDGRTLSPPPSMPPGRQSRTPSPPAPKPGFLGKFFKR
jgi:curved DNA-binding protein CbpA